MRRITTTIALLGLSVVALLNPTAASAASDVEVTSATLVARGIAVDLTITVTCPAGASGGAELILRQRSGDRVAYGSGWSPLNCTGEPQAVTGRVYAENGGLVFHKGIALASGGFELCQDGCDYPRFEGTVRITR
ncbi:hypothetical protein O7631_28900 [Micromonospora sp. WMMD967]|uniref:hypothetical protein n=1 Tax=Micromonospora sp. WMMD967 TaxID=3016101 RepID=UPI002417D172|nr:hypothetical protein [Micromonospora sp. WMMD967]MDG4840563.1 hypothetical protein [Micromonospora sp. WMMD967]